METLGRRPEAPEAARCRLTPTDISHKKKIAMKKIISGGMLLLTCCVLLGVFVALANCRFEFCDPASMAHTLPQVACNASVPTPTLAPSRELVSLQIETDRSDLEVGWAEN
jgi:hypothetical protein